MREIILDRSKQEMLHKCLICSYYGGWRDDVVIMVGDDVKRYPRNISVLCNAPRNIFYKCKAHQIMYFEVSEESNEIRFKVLERDGYKCVNCGKNVTVSTSHIDHIIPKSKGGTEDLMNLRTLCPECHAKRHPKVNIRVNKDTP